MTSHVDQAARRFFGELVGESSDHAWHYNDHPAKPLVRAAFALYAEAWRQNRTPGSRWDVRQWQWPLAVLRHEGGRFCGDQPWSVLLRRAVELARQPEGAAP